MLTKLTGDFYHTYQNRFEQKTIVGKVKAYIYAALHNMPLTVGAITFSYSLPRVVELVSNNANIYTTDSSDAHSLVLFLMSALLVAATKGGLSTYDTFMDEINNNSGKHKRYKWYCENAGMAAATNYRR